MTQKVDRFKIVNDLWMKILVPRIGDKIEFKIPDKHGIHNGKIKDIVKVNNKISYSIDSKSLKGRKGGSLRVIKVNGISIRTTKEALKEDGFKKL